MSQASSPTVTVFAGPSTVGLSATVFHAVDLRPPARRGDVPALLAGRAPGVLVLADGVFADVPAVSHAELCDALDAGWAVWGVSSLGAIRAWEMRGEGMHGFGWVYAQFARHAAAGDDFTDDELALLHLPVSPWTPMTEALVNLRHALQRHGPTLGIPPTKAALALALLRQSWFGDRSPELLLDVMVGPAGIDGQAASALLAAMAGAPGVKAMDLWRLLRLRPWLRKAVPSRPRP